MKKGIVCVYTWQRGIEEIEGNISIEGATVNIIGTLFEYKGKHLTIPLTSVMMIEWEK